MSKPSESLEPSLPSDPFNTANYMNLRIDALSELLDLERQASAGEPVDEEEIEEGIARCIDVAMAQEMSWL